MPKVEAEDFAEALKFLKRIDFMVCRLEKQVGIVAFTSGEMKEDMDKLHEDEQKRINLGPNLVLIFKS